MTPPRQPRKIKPPRKATLAKVSDIRGLVAESRDTHNAFKTSFSSTTERAEAALLMDWLLTSNLPTFLALEPDPEISRGENPPDFVLYGNEEVAVEATTFVTPRKAIYDKEPPFEGAYTTTLLDTPPDSQFKERLKHHDLPDNSQIGPIFIAPDTIDAAYFRIMQPVIQAKAVAAKNYAGLYTKVIILVKDSLSEIESALEPRLPILRQFVATMNLPPNVTIIVMNTGFSTLGIGHELTG